MATVERLPGRLIQDRLTREYGLRISHGGIIGLLQRMAAAGQPTYEQLQQEVRASPVIHADETGWRENGQHTTVWTVSTSHLVSVSNGRRTKEAIDGILGADFGGTIVADCYAVYNVRPVLPKRTSARVAVGKASSGSPAMTTLCSTEVQYLPLMVNGGTAQFPG
jgi:Transposase IS66 family